MIFGTCYFPSVRAAVEYYAPDYDRGEVLTKLKEGEIKVGRPPAKSSERVILLDDGLRYGLECAA